MKLVFIYFVLVSYLFSSSIFVYHRFNDDRHKSTSTSNKSLIAQFEYLKKHNYKVVKLSQMIEKIKNNQSIPTNWVALTIDDGYKSFYKNGFKIFKKYGYPFTMFVYMKASKKRYGDFMNFKQLKEISKYGELGLHSIPHSLAMFATFSRFSSLTSIRRIRSSFIFSSTSSKLIKPKDFK
jgi:hypothetical protein